jgi:hypothetical protein
VLWWSLLCNTGMFVHLLFLSFAHFFWVYSSAILMLDRVICLPLINIVVGQMHRAAFVLPTFVKKELEAYCTSTERVSCYNAWLNDDFISGVFSQFNNIFECKLMWREFAHYFTGTARGNSCNNTKDTCFFQEWNSYCILRLRLATCNFPALLVIVPSHVPAWRWRLHCD